MIDAALKTYLLTIDDITDIIDSRIYFDRLPLSPTLPAITLSVISEMEHRAIPDAFEARIQISCWSNPSNKSPQEIGDLKTAVSDAVTRTTVEKGSLAWTSGTTTYSIYKLRAQNAPRMIDPTTKWYHSPVDALISYRRSTT